MEANNHLVNIIEDAGRVSKGILKPNRLEDTYII
jgi:hypothetical protein